MTILFGLLIALIMVHNMLSNRQADRLRRALSHVEIIPAMTNRKSFYIRYTSFGVALYIQN